MSAAPGALATAVLALSQGLRCLAGVRCFRLPLAAVLCPRSAAGGSRGSVLHFGFLAVEGLFEIFCATAVVYYTQYRRL